MNADEDVHIVNAKPLPELQPPAAQPASQGKPWLPPEQQPKQQATFSSKTHTMADSAAAAAEQPPTASPQAQPPLPTAPAAEQVPSEQQPQHDVKPTPGGAGSRGGCGGGPWRATGELAGAVLQQRLAAALADLASAAGEAGQGALGALLSLAAVGIGGALLQVG